MSDVVSCFEVERDVAGGEHRVTVYVDVHAAVPSVRVSPSGAHVVVDLTADEAAALADVLHTHAQPAKCWRCGLPSMPGDTCPRCQEAGL